MSYQNGPPKIVTDGLVLMLDPIISKSYPGSGNIVYDLSGRGNNGTINGATYWSDGRGSFNFDGTSDFINCSPFGDISSGYSICQFVKPGSSSDIGLFSTLNPSNYICKLSLVNYVPFFQTYLATAFYATSSVLANEWSQITCTFDGVSTNGNTAPAKIYINSILFGSNTVAGFTTSSSYCRIGRVTSTYFDGLIGYTMFYNKALSANEVSQNYNATKYRFGL